MSFTDQKLRVATEADLRRCWLAGKPGEYFRCCMCGRRLKLGDHWRWVYTNDMKGAGGNPLICETCDGEDVRERWAAKCAEFYSDKNWFFLRRTGT